MAATIDIKANNGTGSEFDKLDKDIRRLANDAGNTEDVFEDLNKELDSRRTAEYRQEIKRLADEHDRLTGQGPKKTFDFTKAAATVWALKESLTKAAQAIEYLAQRGNEAAVRMKTKWSGVIEEFVKLADKRPAQGIIDTITAGFGLAVWGAKGLNQAVEETSMNVSELMARFGEYFGLVAEGTTKQILRDQKNMQQDNERRERLKRQFEEEQRAKAAIAPLEETQAARRRQETLKQIDGMEELNVLYAKHAKLLDELARKGTDEKGIADEQKQLQEIDQRREELWQAQKARAEQRKLLAKEVALSIVQSEELLAARERDIDLRKINSIGDLNQRRRETIALMNELMRTGDGLVRNEQGQIEKSKELLVAERDLAEATQRLIEVEARRQENIKQRGSINKQVQDTLDATAEAFAEKERARALAKVSGEQQLNSMLEKQRKLIEDLIRTGEGLEKDDSGNIVKKKELIQAEKEYQEILQRSLQAVDERTKKEKQDAEEMIQAKNRLAQAERDRQKAEVQALAEALQAKKQLTEGSPEASLMDQFQGAFGPQQKMVAAMKARMDAARQQFLDDLRAEGKVDQNFQAIQRGGMSKRDQYLEQRDIEKKARQAALDARAQFFRDFRSGNVSQEELAQAQGNLMQGVAQQVQASGKLGFNTVEAFKQTTQALAQQAQAQAQQADQIGQLTNVLKMLLGGPNGMKKAQMAGGN